MSGFLSNFYIRVYTWLHGEFMGEDAYGTRYYRRKGASTHGKDERRWAVYRGVDEASKVPPEWHGWLHYGLAAPLSVQQAYQRPWQKKHQANQTGTLQAYKPPGYTLGRGRRDKATGDYESWNPDENKGEKQ